MPRGSRPGEHRGGRRAGTPNRSTTERALVAEQTVQRARTTGRKLAKEHLDDLLHVFMRQAQKYQPSDQNQNADQDQFERWASHAYNCARALAPYQSPTFRAVVVAPAPDTQSARVTRFQLRIIDNRRGEGMTIDAEQRDALPAAE